MLGFDNKQACKTGLADAIDVLTGLNVIVLIAKLAAVVAKVLMDILVVMALITFMALIALMAVIA